MSRFLSLSLAVVLLLASSAASAVDLTGSYTGKLTCTGLDGTGNPVKEKNQASVMDVVQTGPDVFVTVDGLPFEGAILNEVGKEDKEGTATVSACDNDGDPAARLEAMQLEAKVAPGSGKTTLKVDSVRGSGGGFRCTGTYKRTTDELPEAGACPVFYSCVCSGTGGGSGACGNGGVGGDPGNLHTDVSQELLDTGYVNGNDTGWVCVAQ
jgi:hypothetical protein